MYPSDLLYLDLKTLRNIISRIHENSGFDDDGLGERLPLFKNDLKELILGPRHFSYVFLIDTLGHIMTMHSPVQQHLEMSG